MGKVTNELGLLPWSSIARAMDVSVATVQRDYAKALVKLRKALADEGITDAEFSYYLSLRFRQPSAVPNES